MPEEQFNPLDVLERAESIFPSGPAADQKIDVSSYDDWITAKDIQDPLEGHLGYGDYLREEYVKADAYSSGVEQTIQNEFGSALVQKGLLTNENKDEISSRIDAHNQPTFEQKVRDMVAHTGLEKDDWHNGVAYLNSRDTATPEELALITERAEASVANTRNNIVQAKLDGGEIAFGRFTDADGNSFVKAGDLALAMPLHAALRKSQEAGGGVNMTDALSIKSTGLMDVQEGMSAPRFKLIQLSEIEKLIHSEVKNNPNFSIQVEALGKRMAEKDYSSFDHFEEGFRKHVSMPVRKFFEGVIGTISNPDPMGTEREEAVDNAMSQGIDETVMHLAHKYNKDPDAVRTALQEVVVNNAPMKVFKDEDDVGKNIRMDGYGLPYVPAAVKLNDDLFDSALEARANISAATKEAMRTERDAFLTNNFVEISKKLTNSELSKKWLDHLNAGRSKNIKDRDILLAFTSNEDNRTYADTIFGDLDLGWKDLYRPFTSAFSTVFALSGADWAKEHLKDIAEDNNQRRELAELFGGKLGMTQDLIKLAPEVTVDIAATALLSKFGGRAAATSLAATKAPLYATMTKKGVLKALTTNAFRRKAGQGTADLAENLAAQNLIRNATSKTALDALEAYNKVNLRAITVTSIGLTAANRSAGATYGTVYNQMLKSGSTEAEAHDRALGTGMVAGTVTGLVTGTFSAFGMGGLEDALLRGMSYRNFKDITARVVQKADHVSLDGVSDAVLQSAIKESAKSLLRKNFLGKGVLRAGAHEFAEESIDEFINTFVTDAGLEQDTPIFDHMKHSLYAGVLGGIMGSAAPVVAAGARRVRPDRMQEIQQAQAYEANLITDITKRLKESNSEITANVVGDLLRGDLYTMPERGALTEEDADAETLAEVTVVDEEQLEEVLAALRDVSPESIQEEIEAVMGNLAEVSSLGLRAPAMRKGKPDELGKDDTVFVLDEDGNVVYADDLIADETDDPKLREILETNPRLLTMDQALWDSYNPNFPALVKERFKKDKDGNLATSLTEEQQNWVDAKIEEFWRSQANIAARQNIKRPTYGLQPLKDLGLTKEEYVAIDEIRQQQRGRRPLFRDRPEGITSTLRNTKPVSEQGLDDALERVTKFQVISTVTYATQNEVPFAVGANAQRTVAADGTVTDTISRGYFSTRAEAQKAVNAVGDTLGIKSKIVPVSVVTKKKRGEEVGKVKTQQVTKYHVWITKKAPPEGEEVVEEEELAPMPEVGETIKFDLYTTSTVVTGKKGKNIKVIEPEEAEVIEITDEGVILVKGEYGPEEVKLSQIVTDKKEAKRAAKTTRKAAPKKPKAELVGTYDTPAEANMKMEELRKEFSEEQADIEVKSETTDRTDFSKVTSGDVPVFEEGGLEEHIEAESELHNKILNGIKDLDPSVEVRDGKKPLLTFKDAKKKLLELLAAKNSKEAKAEAKERRTALEEIEATYEKAIANADFELETEADTDAAWHALQKAMALRTRLEALTKLEQTGKVKATLKEAQKAQAKGTPLLVKGRGNTLRAAAIVAGKGGALKLKTLTGKNNNPITPVDINGNLYLVTHKTDSVTGQKVWHEFGRQDVGVNYNTKTKFLQYLEYGPKDAPSKMPWESLRLTAEESAEVGAIAYYGLPPSGLSRTKRFGITKQRKAKGFYQNLNRAITKRIYQMYPVRAVSRPVNGSVVTATDQVTGFSPWAEVKSPAGKVVKGKKRKDPNLLVQSRYRPKAFVHRNGVGVFDNDPVAMSVLMDNNHPIIIPDDFTGRINTAFRYDRIDGDLVVYDIIGVGQNGVSQSMKRKKETTTPFSRTAMDKEVGFLGLFKALSAFRNDATNKTAEVENPNGAGITTVEDLLNNLNDIIDNARKVNVEEKHLRSDKKRIAGVKLGEDATLGDQQDALESIGFSSKRAAAKIDEIKNEIRITEYQILAAATEEDSARLKNELAGRQAALQRAIDDFSNTVVPAAQLLATVDENVQASLDRFRKVESEANSLQRRLDATDETKKVEDLGKNKKVQRLVKGLGDLRAQLNENPENQDLVDRLAALEKKAKEDIKYQEYEAASKALADLYTKSLKTDVVGQLLRVQERQTMMLENLHRSVLAKEKLIAGGSVAATRDPFAAKAYLDRILTSRRGGKIEEDFIGDAEAALRTEYELHTLMFQIRQDMRPFVDEDGNLRGIMDLEKVGGEIAAAKAKGKVPVALEKKQGQLKRSVKANRNKAFSLLFSRINHKLIVGPTAKKTAKGAIHKEAKQKFAVVLNDHADLGVDNAEVNYVEVYRQFIEKLFINGPTYWARGDTLPSFMDVGQRVARKVIQQQARRNTRGINKQLYGEDSTPYDEVQEILSEEERLNGEDKGQALFFRHFIANDLNQSELTELMEHIQADAINILEHNPKIRRAWDKLLKNGPFKLMDDFSPSELSAASAWAEMVSYVRQASIGETTGVESGAGPAGPAGIEGGAPVTIDGKVVRRKAATGSVGPLIFLKELETGSTPEAQAIKRAFRIYRMADFHFTQDPFKTANEETIAELKEILVDPEVSAEAKSAAEQQLSEVNDALEYTTWLKDEIRFQLAHRVDDDPDLSPEHKATILNFQAQNVHKVINEMQARSYFSKSQFAKAIDIAVAENVNNRVARKLGLLIKITEKNPDVVLEAMDKIYNAAPAGSDLVNAKEYQRMMAKLFASDQPNAAFVRSVVFRIGAVNNSYASKTEVLADGKVGVTINVRGWNGRGLMDTVIRSFAHAKLLDTLKNSELTESQQKAKGKIEETIKALRGKFGGNTQLVMRSGTKSLNAFIDYFFDSSDFQSALKVRLSKKGMPSYDATLNNLLTLMDSKLFEAERDAEGKVRKAPVSVSKLNSYRKHFKDMMDLAGFTYSSPLTPDGVRDEAVAHASHALKENESIHKILGSRFRKRGDEKGLTEIGKKDLTDRANLLGRLAMSRVPAEIEVVLAALPDGRVALFDRVSGKLLFDPRNAAIATLERGMDNISAQGMAGRVIREEMAHKSAKAALTAGMVKAVMDASSTVDYQNDIDAYYGEGTPEAKEAEERLKGDPDKAFKEKELLVQERLATLTQKIMDNQTTEEAEAFFSANPSTLSVAIFYIKKFINGFVRAFRDGTKGLKPEERIAVNRMLVELRGMEMGYRMPRHMDPKAGPEETTVQFLETAGFEPTEKDDTIKVNKTTLPQKMPSGLEAGAGSAESKFAVEGAEDIAYMEAVKAGDTKAAKEILDKATDGITVASFRQLAHTVTLQRMGVGSLLRAQQEYAKKQDRLVELEPAEDETPSKEHAELKKFFKAEVDLQQKVFDLWEEKTKVGPKHLEIIVRDKDGNPVPLSQRLGFDVNVAKEEAPPERGERIPVTKLDELGAPVWTGDIYTKPVEEEEQTPVKVGRLQPNEDALLKMFASDLGLKVDATIDKGGVLYSGFRAKGPQRGSMKATQQSVKNFVDAAVQVADMTQLGLRSETAKKGQYFLSWSNAHNRWDVRHQKVVAGKKVELDANHMLITAGTVKEAERIAENLPVLPLSAGAFEKAGVLGALTQAGIRGKVAGLEIPKIVGERNLEKYVDNYLDSFEEEVDDGGVLYSGFRAKHKMGDTDFDAFDFDYTKFFAQFDMPMLEVDELNVEKGIKGFMKKHLVGLLQPEIHHWMKHRQALKKTIANELKMMQVQLRGLIEQVYPDGTVPVDSDGLTIIQKATGSTEGVFLSDAVAERLDNEYNDAKKAAWLNAHTESQQDAADIKQIQKDQKEAIKVAKAKYDADIKTELIKRRAEIVAERDAARARIAVDSRELLEVLLKLRDLADKFTIKLEAIHKVSGKYDVKISDNNGIYLTRTYKMFLDVGYADAVRKNPEYQEERDEAIKFFEEVHLENAENKLRMEHPTKTDAEIKQMAKDSMVGQKIGERALEAFISSYEMKGNGEAYFSAQESIKSMIDNFKAKKNIPEPLRKILGEQKDTTTPDNLLRTMMTVGSMAANQSFLNAIAKSGLDNGWLVTEEEFNSDRLKYTDPDTHKEWQRVVQHTSDREYNPLSGLYGRPELAGAFTETFKEYGTSYANDSEQMLAGSFRYFQKLTGYSMASKTLGSTGFYLRNGLSNILFFGPMQMGGIGNMFLAKDYLQNFLSEVKRAHKGDRAKLDAELTNLRSLRIIGDESRTNTMRQLMLGERSLEDVETEFLSKMEEAEGVVGKAKEKAEGGLEYLSRLAAAMDAFYKIAYFKHELGVLEEAYAKELADGSMTPAQVEQEAAKKVLRTSQAYSEAPPLVRALQRSVWGSFFAPFVRFKADVIRVMYNTVKVALEERASGNAVLIKRGNQRLRGFTFTIGVMSFLIPLLLRTIFGVGEEEDEAYKAAGPKWAKHNTLWYFRMGGELKALNLTFLNPFSTVMDGVNSAVLGEFFGGGSVENAIEVAFSAMFVDQFLDDQIFSSALKEAFVTGIDETTGKRVWTEGVDRGTEKVLKQLWHTWEKGFEPRTWTKLEAAWKASGGDYTELAYSPMGIIGAEFLPVRWRTVKPDQLFKQYTFKMEQARSQVREKFRPIYNKNVSVSEDEIMDIYEEVYKDLKHLNKDIIRKMGGFEGLGLSKGDIYRLARGSGGGPKMGKRRTELLMQGYMEKPVLSANKVAIMMQEAEADPKMAERLRIFAEAMSRHDRFSKIVD